MNTDADRTIERMQSDLATLAANYAAMAKDIAEIKQDLKSMASGHSQRLAALEVGAATCQERWVNHAGAHRTENRIITVVATIISSAIASAIGVIDWFRSNP